MLTNKDYAKLVDNVSVSGEVVWRPVEIFSVKPWIKPLWRYSWEDGLWFRAFVCKDGLFPEAANYPADGSRC